jgi:hypothetical protein
MDAGALDLERLRRAVRLEVVRVRHGEYVVHGHRVTGADVLVCDCADSVMRHAVVCKHRLAVELRRGNPEVLAALAALVPVRAPREPNRPRQRPRGARSSTRRIPGHTPSTAGARGGLTP